MTKRKITKQEDLLNRIRAMESDMDDFVIALGEVDTRAGLIGHRVKKVENDIGSIQGRLDLWKRNGCVKYDDAFIGSVIPLPKLVVRKWWQFWKRG